MRSSRLVLTVLAGVSFFLACGGGSSSNSAAVTCGGAVCSAGQICDESGDEPSCVCREGFTGDSCSECAPGYERQGSGCLPVAIDCDDDPCGARGVCVSETGKRDTCECVDGYSGPTCEQCTDGYQDNDDDGSCEQACDHPEPALDCNAPHVCDDTSGAAVCICPPGTTGDDCKECEEGRARRGDGDCYLTCNSADIVCEEPQHCFDDGGKQPAECRCDAGYTGESCSECEAGFDAVGEFCVRGNLGSSDFLSVGKVDDRATIVALDSESGELRAMRSASGTEGLVYEPGSERLFVASYTGVGELNLVSGEITELSDVMVGHGKPIAYDTAADRLLTLRSNDYYLMAVDPDNGALSEVVPTSSSWVWDATYNPDTDALLVLRSQGLTPSIDTISLDDGTTTTLGTLAEFAALNSTAMGGIAVTSAGELAVLAPALFTEDDLIEQRCREAADRLGFDDYDSAPATLTHNHTGPGGTLDVTSSETGKELVIYRSYNGPGTTLNLALDNPEAFVCISTSEEDLTLQVEEGVRWAGGVVYTYQSTLDADVDAAFLAETPMVIFGGSEANLLGAALQPQAFRLLSATEASDRKLPQLSDYSLSTAQDLPYTLNTYSLPSLTLLESVKVKGHIVAGLSTY